MKKSTQVIQATFWVYSAAYSGKILVFLSTVVLARLLLKEEFGLVGYALIVIGFLDMVQDLGIGAALIYQREDPMNYDTAFWLNLVFGLFLFGLTWIIAPLAGEFFNDPRSLLLTRTLALTFPITALGNVQDSILRKDLAFNRKLVPDFIKAMSKGIISIILAWRGFGVWSLVIGQIAGTAISTFAYWWLVPWRPSINFDLSRARSLLSYGINIVAVNGLAGILNNIDYLLIGRYLGAEALGVYTLAFRLPQLLIQQFNVLAGQVVFPTYSKIRGDNDILVRGFILTTRYISLITIPVALGLASVSKPFILTFYTEKWVDAIPVMSAIAIVMLFQSIMFTSGAIYKAKGQPKILTKIALLRAFLMIPALWWAATKLGTIFAVAWIQVIIVFLIAIISLVVAARVLNLSYRTIFDTLQPALISGGLMVIAVIGILKIFSNSNPILQLVAGTLTGVIIYASSLWWLQRDIVIQAGTRLRAAISRT